MAGAPVFFAGLIGAPTLVIAVIADRFDTGIASNSGLILCGGLLVGLGTRIGNGCTSGHGDCEISRFSIRGIVATCTFISVGAVTTIAMRVMGG